jgi:hypothetical protein
LSILFSGRILPVTKEIADRWGVLDATCQLQGTLANTIDGMIAATALENDLIVVTRDVKVRQPWRRDRQCLGKRKTPAKTILTILGPCPQPMGGTKSLKSITP